MEGLKDLLNSLEREYTSGLEDLEELVERIPLLTGSELSVASEDSDARVLLVTSALHRQGHPLDSDLLPVLLHPSRSGATLDSLCRLVCLWHPAETLNHISALLLAQEHPHIKAASLLFSIVTDLLPSHSVLQTAETVLSRLTPSPHTSEILSICVKSASDALKNSDFETISGHINSFFPKIVDFSGNSEHFLPYLPLFMKYPSLFPSFSSILESQAYKDLLSSSISTRNSAISLLKTSFFSPNPSIFDNFLEMYQSLENYTRHLVQNIWEKRLNSLLNPFNPQLIRLLLKRVRMHENPSVKKMILKQILKGNMGIYEEIMEELMVLIGDSSLFGDAPRNMGVSRFGTALIGYLEPFLCSGSGETVVRYVDMVGKYVEHQAGFYNCMVSLRSVEAKQGFVTVECVKNMQYMLTRHFANITPVQRVEVAAVMLKLLRYRVAAGRQTVELVSRLPRESRLGELLKGEELMEVVGSGQDVGLVVLAVRLTENWEDYFDRLLAAPLQPLSSLYSSAYLPEPVICTCISCASCICSTLLPLMSSSLQSRFLSFLVSATPQFLDFILLQAHRFSHPQDSLQSLLPHINTILAAAVHADSEYIRRYRAVAKEIRRTEDCSLYKALTCISFLYVIVKNAPKELHKSQENADIVEFIWKFDYKKLGNEHKILLSITVLKWKLAKIAFSPLIFPLISPFLPDLLDISSTPMKKTAFRILKKSLRTDFILEGKKLGRKYREIADFERFSDSE